MYKLCSTQIFIVYIYININKIVTPQCNYKFFGRTWALRCAKMRGLIINGPMLLKWNSTHNANSVTALETLRSACPKPLSQRKSHCTSHDHSLCLTEPLEQLISVCNKWTKRIRRYPKIYKMHFKDIFITYFASCSIKLFARSIFWSSK
jgi:hypothetical protein